MLKLKKIELFGFKSFSDRQELRFAGSGIASVVGPNGCGKSNIGDAVSWVLGEQSAKTLRGARMADVIFNGSRDRKPSGLATVSLTLFEPEPALLDGASSNGDGRRPGEITVTRKLFRSGESAYLLNGKNCRLRDIQDLFMGTGLGPNHYAIIEQGRIGQVLSSKPLDRRSIIEEAAGVTKFKSRKRLAELKLESAKQNLHRVNDILQEVTRQTASLKRQASKAQRYSELRTELSAALTTLIAGRRRRLDASLEAAAARRLEADKELRLRAQRAGEVEARLGAARDSRRKVEAELEAGREELSRLTVETERLRSRVAHQTRSAEENANRERHAEAELTALAERLAEFDNEIRAEQEAAEAVLARGRDVQSRLAEKNRELESRQAAAREREQQQETARRKVIALLGEASQARNQLAKVEEFLAGNERHAARLRAEEEAARKELEQVAATRAELAETQERRRAELKDVEDSAAAVERDLTALRLELKERRGRSEEMQGELSKLRARRDSLDEVLSRHAYTTDTVKALFAAVEAGDVEGLRPLGVLADIIEVDPKHERAAEEFLRDELEFVVVKSWDEARRGVEVLRGQLRGHATFLVEPDAPAPLDPPALGPETGVSGRLADAIRLQNGLADSASTLLPKLRGCYLVEDEATAHRLAVRYPDLYFLPPNGACYQGHTVAGGKERGAGPLALKRELRELGPKLTRAEAAFEENRQAAAAAEERLGVKTTELERLRLAIREAEKSVVALEHEARRLDEQTHRGERRAAAAKQDLDRLRAEGERAETERERRAQEIEQREREKAEAEEALELLRRTLDEAQAAVRALVEEQSKLRAEAAALEERRRGAQAALGRLRQSAEELSRRRAAVGEQRRSWEAERLRLVADNEKLTAEIAREDERREALNERVRRSAAELERLRSEVNGLEEEAQKIREVVEEARARHSRIELDVVRIEADRGRLAEMCERELKQSLEAAAAGCDRDPSDEETAEAERAYQDLREKIERLGPVNVLALEEFEEAARRQEFLETQQSDLLESIRDTQAAIHEIDAASRKQFQEAFEAVNAGFRETFQTLFGGGVGEMRLSDPDNPGESGIDIVASPPGKKLQNVALLSGGEKSLTALALLMATFKYKPSPFCLLDEVDAALDEPNNLRLRRLIEEMSDRTQFILITHSKTTMAAAETLYGVTMQEPGVSKLVSVRMGDHSRGLSGRPERPTERAAVPVSV